MWLAFFNNDFLENARLALLTLAESTKELNTVLCVGFPYSDSGALYSCYAVIHRGQIRAIIPLQTSVYPFANPKTQSKGTATLHTQYEVPFLTGTFQIQCGSVSATLKVTSLNNIPFADPQFSLSCQDASIVICPSATHIYAGTSLRPSLKQFSKHYAAALLFINASPNESSGEHVFLGDCGIYELGQELTSINYLKSKPFSFNTNKCIFSDVDIQYIQQYKQRHALNTSNEVSMNEPQPTLLPIDLQVHQVAKLKYPLSPTLVRIAVKLMKKLFTPIFLTIQHLHLLGAYMLLEPIKCYLVFQAESIQHLRYLFVCGLNFFKAKTHTLYMQLQCPVLQLLSVQKIMHSD